MIIALCASIELVSRIIQGSLTPLTCCFSSCQNPVKSKIYVMWFLQRHHKFTNSHWSECFTRPRLSPAKTQLVSILSRLWVVVLLIMILNIHIWQHVEHMEKKKMQSDCSDYQMYKGVHRLYCTARPPINSTLGNFIQGSSQSNVHNVSPQLPLLYCTLLYCQQHPDSIRRPAQWSTV